MPCRASPLTKARKLAERRGRRGEALAALYLRCCGWRILARRVALPGGEIDLIARRGGMVAFVEVKWRRSAAERDLAIDAHRLRRVAAAVEGAAHRYAGPGDVIRIDAVLLAPGCWPRHLANVWQP